MLMLAPVDSDTIFIEDSFFISTEMGGVINGEIKSGRLSFNKKVVPVHVPYKGLAHIHYGESEHLRIEKNRWVNYGFPAQYCGENLNGKKLIVFPMQALGDQLYLSVAIRNLAALYSDVEVIIVKSAISSAEQWYPYLYFDSFYQIEGPVINAKTMREYDYFVNAEHFVHLPEFNRCYPPAFYTKFFFNHDPDILIAGRPKILNIQDHKEPPNYPMIESILQPVKKTGKPIVFVNPKTNGRVRDIPNKTIVEFCSLSESHYFLIVSTFKNEQLEDDLANTNFNHVVTTRNLIKDVSDLIYLISHVDLVITADSGITHLSEALNTPCGSVYNVVTPEERVFTYKYSEELIVEFEIPGICKTPCYVHAIEKDEQCPGMKYMNDIAGERVFSDYPPCFENLRGESLFQLLEVINKTFGVNYRKAVHCFDTARDFETIGEIDNAINNYKEAIDKKPDYSDAFYSLGNIYLNLGKNNEAIEAYLGTIKHDPEHSDAFYNLGLVYQNQNKLQDAALCYEKNLSINDNDVMALNNLATVYHLLGMNEKAVGYFEKALKLNPGDASIYSNMGAVFQDMEFFTQAEDFYTQSLKLDPKNAMACYNMGLVLQRQNDIEKSVAWYERALRIQPDYEKAFNSLFHCYQHICDWDKTSKYNQKLDLLLSKESSDSHTYVEIPFVNLARCEDPLLNYEVAKFWSDDVAYRMARLGVEFDFEEQKYNKNKIVIGYLSNNFRDHPNAHLIVGLLERHDRDLFEINCYSYGKNDKSYYRKRIEAGCDNFNEIGDLSYANAAKKIFDDGVGILIDLIGFTAGSQMEICAFRPAPIQVRYLGFPGSTGSTFIDYIITDKTMTPKKHQKYYSEKFVYMPNCYQVNDDIQIISDKGWKKTDFDLPAKGFVFCSFSSSYKIDPVIFDSWMRILRKVPGSVLWLLKESAKITENLKKEAESRGVSHNRLVFSEKLKKPEHLARLRLADLALDTRIVTGHITTSDALWAGVPLLTLQGDRFISRAPSSILKNIGLSELITHSLEEYEKLAVELATNPDRLTYINDKLKNNRLSEPLFNTSLFTKNYESGLLKMWEIYHCGREPELIEINESEK